MLGTALIIQLRGRCPVAGPRLRVINGRAVQPEELPSDPLVFQAACVEAFVASWRARGFSPVTIENDTAAVARRRHRHHQPQRSAWSAASPGAARPGELDGAPPLPAPPRAAAHHQSAPGRHPRHQGASDTGIDRYFSHLLDPAGVAAHRLRATRLADLVNTMDPKLVAAAFGMRPEAVLIYLADQVDTGRLPRTRATSAAT
jgi:hypothetical protein